jgi:hypothetical protein
MTPKKTTIQKYDPDDCGWSRCTQSSTILFTGKGGKFTIGLCDNHFEKLAIELSYSRTKLISKCSKLIKDTEKNV